jgi:PAS domain S-box-containing protein
MDNRPPATDDPVSQSEERFRQLAEAIPQLVFVVTSAGDVEYLNHRWRDYTGIAGADALSLAEVIQPDDYALINGRWLDATVRGSPFEAEIRIRRASDGVFRWFLVRGVPISGPDGVVAKWFGTSTDIDDQKRAEQAQQVLAEAGRLLAASFDYQTTLAEVGKLVVPKFADWCSVVLVDAEGLVRSCEIVHSDPAKHELKQEYRHLHAVRADDGIGLMRVYRSGKPELHGELSDEHLLLGTRNEEERRVLRQLGFRSVMIVPLKARGRILGAMTFAMAEAARRYGDADLRLALELGERVALAIDNARLFEEASEAGRRREQALMLHCAIEEKLTLLVEASGSLSATLDLRSVSTAILNLSRRLVAADAYAVWHYERSSGHWAISLSAGLSAEYCKATVQVSVQTPRMPESPIISENIGDSPILGSRNEAYLREGIKALLVVPLTIRGERYGTIAFYYREEHRFTEVEVRVATALANLAGAAIGSAQLYEELKTNDRRKDEFLAMLAHELRNPLAAIDSAVSLMGSLQDDDTVWSVDVIGRHVRHLTRMIDDLLDVSRITRGKIELRKRTIDASVVLKCAVESMRPLIEERKHELTTSFGTDLNLVADPTRLEQIIVNLLSNAAKYTECGGQIWLAAWRHQEAIIISVRDTGSGISPDHLPRLFELFVQGDRSLERSSGGLGIGLTLVQKLAELHGGTVIARSDGPGTGSEFTVRFPAAPAAHDVEFQPRADAEPKGPSSARILVVDDNQDLARGLARLLELQGHVVAVAHDGPSGLELARAIDPDFVLLDIGLPGMDGFQVAALLRETQDTKNAVIIAISGYGQDEDRVRSKQAGFDFHLVKPISSHELTTILRGRP